MSHYSTNPALPNYMRPELVETLPDLALIDDLLAGTRRMHSKSGTYIRQWTHEHDDIFAIRSKSEQVFEGLSRILSASVGMIFAKAPSIELGTHEKVLLPHWENIDGSGTKGHVFVKQFTDASIQDGVGLILVDYPPKPVDPRTKQKKEIVTSEDDEVLGRQPTWSSYGRGNVISWRLDKIDNRQEITQVVLYEPVADPDSTFGVTVWHQYRVLRLFDGQASWALFRKVKDTGRIEDFSLMGSGFFRNERGQIYNKLPISVALTGRKKSPLEASVPLLGVAWANLGHWQLSSDLRFYLSISAAPQPTVTGNLAKVKGPGGKMVPGELKVGPMVVVQLEGDSTFGYTVVPPGAHEALEKAINKKEGHMGDLGMSFLAPDSRQAETAEAKRLDATAENASLATVAQGVDDCVNGAWTHHAWFMGIPEDEAPEFGLNRDFENVAMDAQTMSAYVNAVEKAGLPGRLLLEAWQKGGRIPPETDLDELELEMAAAQAAKEEEKRLAQEASLAAMMGDDDEDEED